MRFGGSMREKGQLPLARLLRSKPRDQQRFDAWFSRPANRNLAAIGEDNSQGTGVTDLQHFLNVDDGAAMNTQEVMRVEASLQGRE